MAAFRPEQRSSHNKPTLSPIISGAIVLLLDVLRLGIVGCFATLACSWAFIKTREERPKEHSAKLLE